MRVTHVFHPLFGQTFLLLYSRFNWGEHRVYLRDDRGDVFSLPASWTDVVADDPFVAISEGRSAFRAPDLLELAGLIDRLQSDEVVSGSGSGKEILPDV